ncbi:MAG: DNA primase [Acidobacteria bacterium]|nr:DNA primase [Acidobacteriota bacterium]
MGLFPSTFVDDLRTRADIVQVIQEHVSLKKAGSSYKGLCPFHGEKTPSFHVNRDKGFFHCFGCGVGGDVIKFVELYEKVGFTDAVRLLARKFGMTVPETTPDGSEIDTRDRETLLKIHEAAAGYFRGQLGSPAGSRARQQLQDRGVKPDTAETLGLGYAAPARDALKTWLLAQGFTLPLLVRSGLVLEREGGQVVDRFRNRLIVPIARDTGSVIAFAGRSMDPDQVPKYLNSPETPIYSKSRTLYGLNHTKPFLRKSGFVVLVEGYFDFAQVLQECRLPVVATCGTALTPQQAQLLRRFVSKVVLSFDPDKAGQSAAVRSCDLLVTEGFEVNVAVLPGGDDPDSFVRHHSGKQYAAQLQQSKRYLDYLLDRTAGAHDLRRDDSRRAFLKDMLGVAARIPDAAARDQFADRIAHRAKITESVVRDEIRKAAVERRTEVSTRELPSFGQLKPAERGLLWALLQEPDEAADAFDLVELRDLDGLAARSILEQALHLRESSGVTSPAAFLARLTTEEAQLVTGIAAAPAPPAAARDCAFALKRLRFEREGAAVQREIDRVQEAGGGPDIDRLWQQKRELLQRMATLGISGN